VAVKIKLKRLGKIREPYYRIVVADARTKRDGRAIEEIGKYHPKAEPSFIEVNSERVQHWLSVGAQPTDPVRVLLKITGDWQKFKGEPGSEGTLRTAEPRADKKERFETAAKESQATKEAKEDKGGRSGTQSRTTKPAKDAPAKESTAKKEAPAKEAKSSASPAAADEATGTQAKAADAPSGTQAKAKAADAASGTEAKAADAPSGTEAKAATPRRAPRPRPRTRRRPRRPRQPRRPRRQARLRRRRRAKLPLMRRPRPGAEPDVLEEALEHLVRGIVEYPDDVQVASRTLRRGNVLEVRVHPDDLGKVIGRGGRTARALRTVINALASGRYVRIDLLDANEVR